MMVTKSNLACGFLWYLAWLFVGAGVVSSQIFDGVDCTEVSTAEELYVRATSAVQGNTVQLCIRSDAPRYWFFRHA
jgi:hypothetical protein